MKIGFIGLGNMATAMIGGMLQKGIAKPEDIIGSSKTETTAEKVKTKFVESALQILTQKNRIEQDMDSHTMSNVYVLSTEGHKYVFEELVTSLNVKNDFTTIRSEIINYIYKPKKKLMGKDKELLV